MIVTAPCSSCLCSWLLVNGTLLWQLSTSLWDKLRLLTYGFLSCLCNFAIIAVLVIRVRWGAFSLRPRRLKAPGLSMHNGITQLFTCHPHSFSQRESFGFYYYAVFCCSRSSYASCTSFYLPRSEGRLSQPACCWSRTRTHSKKLIMQLCSMSLRYKSTQALVETALNLTNS